MLNIGNQIYVDLSLNCIYIESTALGDNQFIANMILRPKILLETDSQQAICVEAI